MNMLVIAVFCVALFVCVFGKLSVVYALTFGFFLFVFYGLYQKIALKKLLRTSWQGIKTVKNVLITVMLIGILTALWRGAGSISTTVIYATKLISPKIFLIMVFLLNCLVSFLIGSEIGTAATVGVICAAMARTMNINMAFLGGAVLSGGFFGDRCSPLSTSALLTSDLTQTDFYDNIKRMIKSAVVPFILTCMFFVVLGLGNNEETVMDIKTLFSKEFNITFLTIIPIFTVLILACLRVKVKIAMSISILVSIPICLFVQNMNFEELINTMLFGYKAHTSELSEMINGGGLLSMAKNVAIVSISSTYFGIFKETGILNGIKSKIEKISKKTFPFLGTILTTCVTGLIVCNQTLTIMLTSQICRDSTGDDVQFANDLADSAIVIPPLVPWSIASTIPLTSIGSPTSSLVFAVYLYLIPLWHLLTAYIKHRKSLNH